jgi:hypothetical protein
MCTIACECVRIGRRVVVFIERAHELSSTGRLSPDPHCFFRPSAHGQQGVTWLAFRKRRRWAFSLEHLILGFIFLQNGLSFVSVFSFVYHFGYFACVQCN